MKIIDKPLIFLFIFSQCYFVKAQVDQENLTKQKEQNTIHTKVTYNTLAEIFPTDKIFVLLSGQMPSTWKYKLIGDTLIIHSSSPIYYLSDSIRSDTVQKGRSLIKRTKFQRADTARIVIRLDPLWSGEKVSDAIIINQNLTAQIERLKKKYNLLHLNEFINSADFRCDAEFLSDKERKSLAKFCKEKEEIEQQKIVLPNYHTSEYSLFFVQIYPNIKDFKNYFPESTLNELMQIINSFEKNAGK